MPELAWRKLQSVTEEVSRRNNVGFYWKEGCIGDEETKTVWTLDPDPNWIRTGSGLDPEQQHPWMTLTCNDKGPLGDLGWPSFHTFFSLRFLSQAKRCAKHGPVGLPKLPSNGSPLNYPLVHQSDPMELGQFWLRCGWMLFVAWSIAGSGWGLSGSPCRRWGSP